MKKFKYFSILLTIVLVSFSLKAQEPEDQALSQIELEYTYSDGGTVVLTMNEKLSYRWTAGSFKGVAVSDRIYRSRRIGDEMYLVNWHDKENKNFVSLIIDLKNQKVYGSGLIAYETENETSGFDEATINRTTWLK
jgi:uncharacterized secreted protein with C-terminal beta-propeller domain